MGNVVKGKKFEELCERPPLPGAPPPTGWTYLGEVTGTSPASGMTWVASPLRLPATTKDVRAVRVAWSGRQTHMLAGFMYPPIAEDTASTYLFGPPGQEFSHMSPEFTSSDTWETLNYGGAVDAFSPQQPVLALDSPAGASLTVRFYYRPRVAEAEPYVLPTIPDAPPGVPSKPGCPVVTDLQDLADFLCQLQDKLDALNAKVDDLLDTNIPPEYTPDDETRGPVPTDAPLAKPSTAIGIALELDTPTWAARYGSNPGAYPGMGFVVLGTADGWLPSIPLKHNPQIVMPLPFQVTSIGLDLAPGVSASYRWLWPGHPLG